MWRSLAPAQALVVTKEKDFVLDHGPADGHSELVQSKFAFFGDIAYPFKVVGCVELVIAEKFPTRAVEGIGAGFDGGVKHRGSGSAIFSAEIGRLNLKFLNRVHRRQYHKIRA